MPWLFVAAKASKEIKQLLKPPQGSSVVVDFQYLLRDSQT